MPPINVLIFKNVTRAAGPMKSDAHAALCDGYIINAEAACLFSLGSCVAITNAMHVLLATFDTLKLHMLEVPTVFHIAQFKSHRRCVGVLQQDADFTRWKPAPPVR
jgi:hypothetical protein